MFNFKTSGDKAIAKTFKKLGPKVGAKPVRKGLRAGAKVFADEIKKRVPVQTGALKKGVKVRAGKRSRKYMSVLATTGQGSKANAGDTFYGHIQEYGRAPGGWHKGKLPEQPFIRPAYDAKEKKAYDVTIDKISEETNKLL